MFAKLLPKKFLSCHRNKSASSLSIALDCYPEQLRTPKILYLLKYLIKLLFCPNKSTVFSIYALKLSKSVNIWFSFDLHAFSTYIRNFDRGPITQVFFYLCFSNVTSIPNLFVCTYLSRSHEQNRPVSLPGPDYLTSDFPLIFVVSDLSLSHELQNMYWRIRPCQWEDCI